MYLPWPKGYTFDSNNPPRFRDALKIMLEEQLAPGRYLREGFKQGMPDELLDACSVLGMVPVANVNPTETTFSGDTANAQQWLQSWLDKDENKNDNEKLRKFYRMITGSYNSKVTINISHKQNGSPYKEFKIHTCFNRIDLPQSPIECQNCRLLLSLKNQKARLKWNETLFHQLIDNLMKQAYDFEIE